MFNLSLACSSSPPLSGGSLLLTSEPWLRRCSRSVVSCNLGGILALDLRTNQMLPCLRRYCEVSFFVTLMDSITYP